MTFYTQPEMSTVDEIIRFSKQLELGIVPYDRWGAHDGKAIQEALNTLSGGEREISKRKFRKLWRKAYKLILTEKRYKDYRTFYAFLRVQRAMGADAEAKQKFDQVLSSRGKASLHSCQRELVYIMLKVEYIDRARENLKKDPSNYAIIK